MALSEYRISELTCGAGRLGIGPMPGRFGAYEADLSAILRWGAGMVLTMTTEQELVRCGAERIGEDLAVADITWRHLPIPDFGAPPAETAALWPEVSREAHALLATGGRLFAHCYGGCGRSGMALLRLLVEAGEDLDPALARLRAVRPCAVETEAQRTWAASVIRNRTGAAR